MKKIILILIISLIILIGALGMAGLAYYKNTQTIASIDSFEKCAAKGYPVMEIYPARCAVPNGKTFTQDIGNELEKQDLIRIESPRPNAQIKNPLKISGQARGNWFFEATFPVKLLDENGNILAEHYAQTKNDWMTAEFVPFETELNFTITKSQKGTLILEKDNPSGLPENADELRVPIFLSL